MVKCTNNWAISLPSKCQKFERVKKWRKYGDPEGCKLEEREIFAEKFKPAKTSGKKVGRKTEHNSAHEQKEMILGQKDNWVWSEKKSHESSKTLSSEKSSPESIDQEIMESRDEDIWNNSDQIWIIETFFFKKFFLSPGHDQVVTIKSRNFSIVKVWCCLGILIYQGL